MKLTVVFLTVWLCLTSAHRQSRLLQMRAAKLIQEDDMTHTDFEPKLTYIPRDELESATRQIRKEVEIINNTLTEEEKNELLTDVNNEDPMGYICDKSLMEIKELQYVDQLLCFNTTEEICYKTQKTVYTTQSIEECKENFKKVCWIDMQDKVSSETIRICTTRPEKVCDSQLARELAEKGHQPNNKRCKLFYESVCETQYIEKDVPEDQVECDFIQETMEMNGETVSYPKRVCTTKTINVKKSIPNTECNQIKHEICLNDVCPTVVKKKICEDKEKSFLSSVPVEKCELEPYEVCSTVMKQYPTLVEKENCEIVPRESCDPERVLPKIVVRPVVKKSCVKAESPAEIITEPIQQEKITAYVKFAENESFVNGELRFEQIGATGYINVYGAILGLFNGQFGHGYRIHEFGDTSNNCLATGGYYNPTNENLANQGNLFGTIDGNGTTELSFEMNSGSTLFGDNSIIGRTFVIFENAFGQNSDDDDAGAILVCGIIHTENSEKVNLTNDEGICDQDGVYSQTVNFDNHPAFHPDFGTEPLGPFSINCYDKRIVMQHYSESISKDAINSFDVLVEDYHKGINGSNGYMLPLNVIHILTNGFGFNKLEIIMKTYGTNNFGGENLHASFSDFIIGDKATRFALESITPDYSSDILNGCLNLGTGFSVKDLENDGNDNINCAGKYKGGWWFKKTQDTDCGTCYLNAKNPKWGDQLIQSSEIYLSKN